MTFRDRHQRALDYAGVAVFVLVFWTLGFAGCAVVARAIWAAR